VLLTDDSFEPAFRLNESGLVLVYFKKAGCRACAHFDTVFYKLEKLSRTESTAVTFAVCEVTNRIISIANSRNVKLNRTPSLILFYNGNPLAYYHGSHDVGSILEFIKTVSRKELGNKQATYMEIPDPNVYTNFENPPFTNTVQDSLQPINKRDKTIVTNDDCKFDGWCEFFIPKNEPWRRYLR